MINLPEKWKINSLKKLYLAPRKLALRTAEVCQKNTSTRRHKPESIEKDIWRARKKIFELIHNFNPSSKYLRDYQNGTALEMLRTIYNEADETARAIINSLSTPTRFANRITFPDEKERHSYITSNFLRIYHGKTNKDISSKIN